MAISSEPIGNGSIEDRILRIWAPDDLAESERRPATLLGVIALLGVVLGLLSSVVHLVHGDFARAAFTAAISIPIVLTFRVLRWTRRLAWAIHYLCAVCTIGILISPFLADDAPPVFVGLIGIPLAATVLGGSRTGLPWSVITIVAATASAMRLASDPVFSTLAWSTAIVVGVCAIAWISSERSRERAMDELRTAREQAEFEAGTRAAAERALQESQMRFTVAFRRAPSMLVVTDFESGRILEVNESFSQLTGWSADEVVGHTLASLDAWQNERDQAKFLEAISRHGSVQNAELALRTKAGRCVSNLVSAELIEIGGRMCLLSQAIDITDRKRFEEALEKSHSELEQRVEERGEQLRASLLQLEEQQRLVAVGTLAAGIAHQINNPIGGIAAASEYALLIQEDEHAAETTRDVLATILAEARRCGEIVKSVLRFARREPTKKWIEDLNPIVARAGERAQDYVHARGGRLRVELTREPLLVRMSPIDMEQVVLNLVHNAAESRTDGASVKVETRRVGEEAQIRVTDDGSGIDPELRARILEPFFTTRLKEGGSGLGLSVVHGIVTDHAGQIEIESTIAGGTCFSIHLPLWQEDSRDWTLSAAE